MPKFYVIALLLVGLSSIACFELDLWEPYEPPEERVGQACEKDEDCDSSSLFCDSVCAEQGESRFCERFVNQCALIER